MGLDYAVFCVRVEHRVEGMVFCKVRLGEVSMGMHRDADRTRFIVG